MLCQTTRPGITELRANDMISDKLREFLIEQVGYELNGGAALAVVVAIGAFGIVDPRGYVPFALAAAAVAVTALGSTATAVPRSRPGQG